MATVVPLSDSAMARVKELMNTGRYDSVEQLMDVAMSHFSSQHADDAFDEDEDNFDPDAEADALTGISEEDREAIREGLHDIKAGRTIPADQVFSELRAKYTAMTQAKAS